MSGKYNESTLNRPEGARMLDAPIMRINLQDYVLQIKSEVAWQDSDRNAITLLHNPYMRIVLVALKEGAEMSRLAVDGALSIHLLSGRLWIESDTHSFSLDENEIITLHPRIHHYFFAEQESVVLLTLAGNHEGEF
jgi:quercetin dioxygenase-like cupin family protein